MNFVERNRLQAHKRIVKWGTTAVLRSSGGDRTVLVLEDMFSTRDIAGGGIQRGDRRYFMSPLGEDGDEVAAPDEHEESLVIAESVDDSASTELIFASPPARCSPNGMVVYYELHCRNR